MILGATENISKEKQLYFKKPEGQWPSIVVVGIYLVSVNSQLSLQEVLSLFTRLC